ncbi:MAG: hypothetical protein ACTSWY_00390 [Promethearchaeota archaeon]
MGLFSKIEADLGNTFSLFDVMRILEMGEEDLHEARNLCRQFYQMGFIKRISKNMYKKVNN